MGDKAFLLTFEIYQGGQVAIPRDQIAKVVQHNSEAVVEVHYRVTNEHAVWAQVKGTFQQVVDKINEG